MHDPGQEDSVIWVIVQVTIGLLDVGLLAYLLLRCTVHDWDYSGREKG